MRFRQNRLLRAASMLIICILALSVFHALASDEKYERGRMEDILDVVAKDIQKNFYDPKLKGVDWKAITEKARQRIRQSDHLGDMIAAISSVPYQLYDSHTVFIPPGRSARVDYGFEAEPFGQDVLVYKLRKDGPAIKAGLELGDKIVAMCGFAVKRSNFFEMSRYFEFLNPVAEMQLEIERGSEATRTIKIPANIQQHGRQMMDYNEIRREIDAQEPIYRYRAYEGGVGYLKLRAFLLAANEADAMMSKLKNSSAIIIDLRTNGGGSSETLKAMTGVFAGQSYDMAKAVGREKTNVITIKPSHTRIEVPVFVLIDSSSASASEMFARNMQIRKRALVIGDVSSGRLNEAKIFWENVGAYDRVAFGTEIAVSRLIMSNGDELENHGVTPDVFCIPTTDDLRAEKDPCVDKALELARHVIAESSPARRD